MIDQGNLIKSTSKKWQIPQISSWEVMQQNLGIKYMIQCEKDRKECPTLQAQERNIQYGRVHQHPQSNEAWKERIGWIIIDQSYRDYDGISGEPTEFEWNIFPGFTTLQLYGKVTDLLSRLGETPETFTGRTFFMSMFNDIFCDKKSNEEECLANAKVVSMLAKKFGLGQWSFIGPGSEKKWYSMEENSPQGIWDHIAETMLLEFAEGGCPIFRATTPLSRCRLKAKDTENCRFTLLQSKKRLRLFFA